jgi:hypothetical protein
VKVTALTICYEQLNWLRHNTGWLGRAAMDQELIARAIRGDRVARAICADAWNARRGDS